MSSSAVLYLYVALGQRRGQDALHWIILAVPEGSDRCTYYHVVGGPPQGNNYELQIQANKRVNSNGISASEYVGTIAKSDVNNLKASAQRIAPQFCQSWVVGVLEDVERKGVGEEYLIGEYGSRHMERHQPVTPASNKRATWHLVARTYLSHPALPALHFLVGKRIAGRRLIRS